MLESREAQAHGDPDMHVALHSDNELVARRIAAELATGGIRALRVDRSFESSGPPESMDLLVVTVVQTPRARNEATFEQQLGIPVVMVLRGECSRGSVQDALAWGASGVLFEQDIGERLVTTVRAVAAGQLVIPADFSNVLTPPVLSPRERHVMAMVVLGFTNQEVANKLHITETTVKSHLSSTYRKLGVRSRHEATALVLSDKGLGAGILTLTGDSSPGTTRP
jgi:DNA-binding NarL/FixJ family response regulator